MKLRNLFRINNKTTNNSDNHRKISKFVLLIICTLIFTIFSNIWLLHKESIIVRGQDISCISDSYNILSNLPVNCLHKKIRQNYLNKKYQQVINLGQEVENQYNLSDKALIKNYLALSYKKIGNIKKAKEEIVESIDILSSLLDSGKDTNVSKTLQIKSRALMIKSQIELSSGDFELALSDVQQAENIYIKIQDKEGEIKSLVNQSLILRNLGYLRKSWKILTKAIEETEIIREEKEDQKSINILLIKEKLYLNDLLVEFGDLSQSWCFLLNLESDLNKLQLDDINTNILKQQIYFNLGHNAKLLGERRKYENIKQLKESESLKINTKLNIECKDISIDNLDTQSLNKDSTNNFNTKGAFEQANEYFNLVTNKNSKVSDSFYLESQINKLDILVTGYKYNLWQEIEKLEEAQNIVEELQNKTSNFDINYKNIDFLLRLANLKISIYQWSQKEKLLNSTINNNIEKFICNIIDKIDLLKQTSTTKNLKIESYAYGYLGKFYSLEMNNSDCEDKSEKYTQKALDIASVEKLVLAIM